MTLPNRMYYPLPEAAMKLGCTIKDLYHFAAIGALNISVYFPNGVRIVSLIIPDFLESEIDLENGGVLQGDKWTISGVSKVISQDVQWVEFFACKAYTADIFSGFVYIVNDSFASAEFLNESAKFSSRLFTTQPESEGFGCQMMTEKAIEIDSRFLCVMSDDIENIKASGSFPVYGRKESARTANRKGELIPALIKMIPDFHDVDIDSVPVNKLINMIETLASSKGIEINSPDKNTWARYLGRK